MPGPDHHAALAFAGLADLAVPLRAEWHADEELWMRAAARRWAHGRGLADVAREYAARGDRVSIHAGTVRFEGQVVAVGTDRVDLATGAGLVTIRLALGDGPGALAAPVTIRRSVAARAGGLRVDAAHTTFRARLLELEEAGVRARLGLLWPEVEFAGWLVVGRDHVVVQGAGEVVVPACWLGYAVVDDLGASA